MERFPIIQIYLGVLRLHLGITICIFKIIKVTPIYTYTFDGRIKQQTSRFAKFNDLNSRKCRKYRGYLIQFSQIRNISSSLNFKIRTINAVNRTRTTPQVDPLAHLLCHDIDYQRQVYLCFWACLSLLFVKNTNCNFRKIQNN